MLPLMSKTTPKDSGASSLEKWRMSCFSPFSKSSKLVCSRPVTSRLSGSVIVAGMSTRSTSTRNGLVCVFSAASVGLSYGAASVTFHGLDHLFLSGSSLAGHPVLHATVWTLLATVAVLVRSVLNKAMIMTAVKATDPGATLRTDLWWIEQVLVVLVLGGAPWYAITAAAAPAIREPLALARASSVAGDAFSCRRSTSSA